jgi:hypothetical protein
MEEFFPKENTLLSFVMIFWKLQNQLQARVKRKRVLYPYLGQLVVSFK